MEEEDFFEISGTLDLEVVDGVSEEVLVLVIRDLAPVF
jgi:hypothetical protein